MCVSFNTYKITKINWLRIFVQKILTDKTSFIFFHDLEKKEGKKNRKNKENQSAVDKLLFKTDQEEKSSFADCFIS